MTGSFKNGLPSQGVELGTSRITRLEAMIHIICADDSITANCHDYPLLSNFIHLCINSKLAIRIIVASS